MAVSPTPTTDLEFSEISAALAHEIKNPAAVALAHVNLLRLDFDDEILTFHLNHIEQALTDICDLVRDMLSATFKREATYEVNLCEILAEILETYRAAWPDIQFFFEGICTTCIGQETSLRMIFSNLIKNAVEAIEAAEITGIIELRATVCDDTLEVTIRDNAPTCDTLKPHGNGLGISICRNLAHGIGAELSSRATKSGGHAVEVRLRR